MDEPLHVNLKNAARDPTYEETIGRIQERGECPFCLGNLMKEHKRPILKGSACWFMTANQWPYPEAKLHFLIISRAHVETLGELPGAAGGELFGLLRWLEKMYGVEAGGVGLRFGNIRYNGATVTHLHCHFLVPYRPDERPSDYAPIKFFIGARKE